MPLNTISGGAGNDSIFFTTAVTSFGGVINLNEGDDVFANANSIQLAGASLGGNAGADTIQLKGGLLNSIVGGGKNNDSIALTAAATAQSSSVAVVKTPSPFRQLLQAPSLLFNQVMATMSS